jgi:hypothetical protein
MKVAILERHKEDGAVEGVYLVEDDERAEAIRALHAQAPTWLYTFTPNVYTVKVEYDVRVNTSELSD